MQSLPAPLQRAHRFAGWATITVPRPQQAGQRLLPDSPVPLQKAQVSGAELFGEMDMLRSIFGARYMTDSPARGLLA